MFSSFTETQTLSLCRHHLVKGYIHKSVDTDVIIEASKIVMAGGTWYNKEQQEEIKKLMNLPKNALLTSREKDVAWLGKQGVSREEIAKELNISVNTVDTHLQNIFQKLDIKSMREL